MRVLFLSIVFGCYVFTLYGQKPVLDSSVFNKWPSAGVAELSQDGKFGIFRINFPGQGDSIVVSSTHGEWRRSFWNIKGSNILSDSRSFIFQTAKDSLCLLKLGSEKVSFLSRVVSFRILRGERGEWLSYKPAEGEGKRLVIRRTETAKEVIEDSVENYWFNMKGNMLVFKKTMAPGADPIYRYVWLNMVNGQRGRIWEGGEMYGLTFDNAGQQLTFLSVKMTNEAPILHLWYYRLGMISAERREVNVSTGIDSNLILGSQFPSFSPDGRKLLFTLTEKNAPRPNTNGSQVDIWSYRDAQLQEAQLYNAKTPQTFMASMDVQVGKTLNIESQESRLNLAFPLQQYCEYVLVTTGDSSDFWWRERSCPTTYLVSIKDGHRILLKKKKIPYGTRWALAQAMVLSPNEKYVLYYDPTIGDYFSYEIASGATRNITSGLAVNWKRGQEDKSWSAVISRGPVGVAGWFKEDKAVLLYDNWDLWRLDPKGIEKAVNLTNGHGKAHHIRFRLLPKNVNKDLTEGMELLLTAFDTARKYSGYYRMQLDKPRDPKFLTMGPYRYGYAIKATAGPAWIVRRESAADAPNCYATTNFKSFKAMTSVAPQKGYNWLHAELVTWLLPTRKLCQGMLFKPENFDPRLQYPMIINYYEEQSDELYRYREPEAMRDNINIPYFVSRGYVVFVPDIHYREGAMGESALETVLSGLRHLSKQSWVDTNKIGIQGHSFGGFETNYLVTHTHLFAAAMEGAGVSDMISDYGSLVDAGASNQEIFEIGQHRMNASPWERPDIYLNESAVLRANEVVTPLLMMHNKRDPRVPWVQGVEFFTALRRNGKKVWMLQYDNGAHSVQSDDARDLTVRVEQFFDHYLKDAPPPLWMTEGIPARLKGWENGYGLDKSGRRP